ncbi:MAG TPA: glutamate-5-semialdehyde dehydrogenase [Polyangiales bacterium]|jgi:glutamate-5-semialdehyde dehydrogenase|nr:glutamate-5-semialdehyde dehydrogenase [Polyangiales bacterium]
MTSAQIESTIRELAREAKAASRVLAAAPSEQKNRVLEGVAAALRGPASTKVLEANARDVSAGKAAGLSAAMIDRLELTRARLDAVADALLHIAELPDPVGGVEDLKQLPSGLRAGRMRVPLGVVAMVYESRPNVTVDAAALCLKAGNACILRGGKEAFHSNTALAEVFVSVLVAEGLPRGCVSLVPTTDREATLALIKLDGLVDLVIPRGGEALIRFVSENARVPVIQHYKGVCHVYVDGDADLEMASRIIVNAKVQRPGVCNALETLLVDRACAATFLPQIARTLAEKKVELRGDARARELVPSMNAASDADWDTEYLDLILSVAVVDGLDAALAHIAKHGSYHTEAIITRSDEKAQRFLREVDASMVLVNASTRFNDGGELGLGAEIGISTTKLHAYGPMGLRELTTLKWVGYGQGEVRK